MGAEVGERAPAFELEGTGGRTYHSSDYEGRGVILAFYPGDFTAVCTKQFCSYRDDREQIDGLGMDLLGISPQSLSSHERFAGQYGLNVPLLADPDKRVAKAYGVVGLGGVVRRATFVLDGELVVRYRDVKRLGLSYEDAEDLAAAVAAIR